MWEWEQGNFTLTGEANTATGVRALAGNTTGTGNTATGVAALEANTVGFFNTATGVGALTANATGTGNTATGVGALQSNTTGESNTATGISALQSNTGGSNNTAIGARALEASAAGLGNTAVGAGALAVSITDDNTAVGSGALQANTFGRNNTAIGERALGGSQDGVGNVAIGRAALVGNLSGDSNVAIGQFAGANATGSGNIHISNSGDTDDSGVIKIGNQGGQVKTFIAGISGATVLGTPDPVVINTEGQLGTVVASSRKYKRDVRDMGNASEGLMRLRPVTFMYAQEYDPSDLRQYGLIAEEVAEVAPDLVRYDASGQPEGVRYHLLNVMLVNEVQKQHRKIAQQQEELEQQQAVIAGLSARLTRLEEAEGR